MTRSRDRTAGRGSGDIALDDIRDIVDDIRDIVREAVSHPSPDVPTGSVVVGEAIEDLDASPPPLPGDRATYSFSCVSDGSPTPWHIYRLSHGTQRQRHVASAMTREEAEWVVQWRSARSTLDSEEYGEWASSNLSILPRTITAELRGAALVRGLDYYRSLRVGQPLALVRDPQNEADPWAIVAKTIESRAVAYVAREIAFHIGRSMDRGAMWVAEVAELPRLHKYATIKISRVESRKRRARTPR